MSVPHLPTEIWARIFTHTDPATLSSLSRVNQTFNVLATDKSLFRRHLIEPEYMHPAQHYRRLKALDYPAEIRTLRCSFAHIEMLCVVEDTLVICDFLKMRLICFPSGLSVDVEENIECVETIHSFYPPISVLEQRHVVLPDGQLGFFYASHPMSFAVICVKTGELMSFPVLTVRLPLEEIQEGKHVFAAGNNAEWIAYHTDRNRIALVDWRVGELVETVKVSDGVKYLIGECPAIDGSSIVGLVFEKNRGRTKKVVVIGFDNVEEKFETHAWNTVHSVLRSRDTKTYVMIMTCDIDVSKRMRFSAFRREGKNEMCWQGTLSMRTSPELRENGRVIVSRCGSLPNPSSLHFDGQDILAPKFSPQHAWMELAADGSTREATIPVTMHGALLVWVRRTADGGLVVIRDTGEYNVALVKFVRDGQYYRHIRLQRWKIEGMTSIRVVGDHFIVAKNCHGNLIVLHFGKFCDGAKGVYACPKAVDNVK